MKTTLRGFRRGIGIVLLAFAVAGCAKSPSSGSRSPEASAPPQASVKNKRQKLVEMMRSMGRNGDVIQGLPEPVRSEVTKVVKELDPNARALLATNDSPYGVEQPLLHLAAGGSSPEALYQLAAGQRLGDELVNLRKRSGKTDYTDLVAAARAVSERASRAWLRERSVSAASPSSLTPDLLERIDAVADALRARELRRLARELLVELEPNSADRWLALARAHAELYETRAANEALAEARRRVKTRSERARLARTEAIAAAAEMVSSRRGVQPADLEYKIRLARALVKLDRDEDARALLEPERPKASSHLGLAVALALADLGEAQCPTLPRRVGSILLCAVAWRNHPGTARALDALDKAFQSGKGRDDSSLEGYLALAEVASWSYSGMIQPAQSREQTIKGYRERFDSMRRAAEEAAKLEDRFEGFVLFIDVTRVFMDAQFAASPGTRLQFKPASLDELTKRAVALAKRTPNEPFTQVAILAVACLIGRERDVQILLDSIPRDVDPSNELVFHELRAWNAVHRLDAKKLSAVANDLATLLGELPSESLDRARILLMLAETDAVVNKSAKSYSRLEQVAKPLMAVGVPLAIRLRAAIDVAGAKSRGNARTDARAVLATVLADMSGSSGSAEERNLALVAGSYSAVLGVRDKKGDERKQLRQRFVSLGEDPFADATASTRAWRDLWLREIDSLIAEEQCGNAPACVARARHARTTNPINLDDRVGGVAAELMRHGTLPSGAQSTSIGFVGAELVAVVTLQPAFLAAESPPTLPKKIGKPL